MSIVQSGILILCVMCNEIKSCGFFWGRGEAHFVGVGAEEQEIEGDGSHEVDEKPAPQIVHSDLAWVWFYFVRDVHVRRAEVDKDVYYKSHVNWKKKMSLARRLFCRRGVYGNYIVLENLCHATLVDTECMNS